MMKKIKMFFVLFLFMGALASCTATETENVIDEFKSTLHYESEKVTGFLYTNISQPNGNSCFVMSKQDVKNYMEAEDWSVLVNGDIYYVNENGSYTYYKFLMPIYAE